MFDRLWEFFVNILISIFLPIFCLYQAVCNNIFLNVSFHQATGIEKAGDLLLVPFQYLFAGKEASLQEDGSWIITQKFNYTSYLLPKTIASVIALPGSLALGSALKGFSFLSSDTRRKHASLVSHYASTEIRSNHDFYSKIGIHIGDLEKAPFISSQNYLRRPGDEQHLQTAKDGLRDISHVLNKAGILWWVDCGTLLGTYRYGGVIPWDNDVDIAILLPDFENARRAFNQLDRTKYDVQDWSSRESPSTYFKILCKKTNDLIDIYFYNIDAKAKECAYIFSLDTNIFFFDWWKQRERRFTKPISFNHLFPLKKAFFDGIEVFVPNEPTLFLQRYYGENLAPARIYNATTNLFEKDLTHPYWQSPYVH